MRNAVVVLITCPNLRQAKRLTSTLVSKRLAACVNVIPRVESIFWWQGKLNRASEALLIVKTTRSGFEPLRRAVVALHPYEVPEIIALPIEHGHAPYLKWVHASVRPRRQRRQSSPPQMPRPAAPS